MRIALVLVLGCGGGAPPVIATSSGSAQPADAVELAPADAPACAGNKLPDPQVALTVSCVLGG